MCACVYVWWEGGGGEVQRDKEEWRDEKSSFFKFLS